MASPRWAGLLPSLLLLITTPAFTLQWYASNIAAEALVPISATMAKRAAWALLVEQGDTEKDKEVSADLRAAVLPGFRFEKKTLWQSGTLYGKTWTVFDDRDVLRYLETLRNGKRSSESYSDAARLLFERQDDYFGQKVEIRYTYGEEKLLKVSCTRIEDGPDGPKQSPLWEDTCFYTRKGALRLVQRLMADGVEPSQSFRLQAGAGIPLRLETWAKGSVAIVSSFDALGRETERSFLADDGTTAKSTERYSYASTTAKAGIVKLNLSEVGSTILVETETDERGHVIAERHLNPDGKLLETIENEWTAGHLSAVSTTSMADDGKTPAEKRRSEYEYDAKGAIILERDFREGELERAFTRAGSLETEELYQHGTLILRARYEDGQKVSEELFPLTERPPDAK